MRVLTVFAHHGSESFGHAVLRASTQDRNLCVLVPPSHGALFFLQGVNVLS